MILFNYNKRYYEYEYNKEEEIENDVIKNSQLFFGNKSIFIEAKKKIDSKAIGATIPDGFLFDFSEPDNPEFYIVEVELASHDFYRHIFPQVTKFFAFFKNQASQNELVEKLFTYINSDSTIKKEFKKLIGEKEVYKSIKDIVENSKNILLVIDDEKAELPEIIDTYTDTWGKMVKLIIVKKFINGEDSIFTINPDFNDIQFTDADSISRTETTTSSSYTEQDHLENVNEQTFKIYNTLKQKIFDLNPQLIYNPQRYYISIRADRNIAFLIVSKKKIRMVIMLDEDRVKEIQQKYQVVSLSSSVQKFYNGSSCAVEIDNDRYLDEIIKLIEIKLDEQKL